MTLCHDISVTSLASMPVSQFQLEDRARGKGKSCVCLVYVFRPLELLLISRKHTLEPRPIVTFGRERHSAVGGVNIAGG